jgi:hypothetical protein
MLKSEHQKSIENEAIRYTLRYRNENKNIKEARRLVIETFSLITIKNEGSESVGWVKCGGAGTSARGGGTGASVRCSVDVVRVRRPARCGVGAGRRGRSLVRAGWRLEGSCCGEVRAHKARQTQNKARQYKTGFWKIFWTHRFFVVTVAIHDTPFINTHQLLQK